jgi:hypothetical protein
MTSDTRRARLRQWIDAQFDGKVANFVRHYSLAPSMASYLSQLLSGHRSFGERAARKIEGLCGRPSGWLDVTDSSEPDTRNALRYDSARCKALANDERELIEDFIALVLKRSESRRNAVTNRTPLLVEGAVVSPSAAVRENLRRAAGRPPRGKTLTGENDKQRPRQRQKS